MPYEPHDVEVNMNEDNAGNGPTTGTDAAAARDGDGGDRTIVRMDPDNREGNEAPKEQKIPDDQRSTTPYMTKYEKARVIGSRATQIS